MILAAILLLAQAHPADGAIARWRRAVAENPRSAQAHLQLGQAYLARGSAELIAEAKAEFQQARELDPSLSLASFFIAKVDLDLGRFDAAARELERLSPAPPHVLALLAEVRRQQGRPEEAVQLATQAVDADANAIPALYFRARAYWDLRDEAPAIADLNRAIASPYATPDMFVALGTIHLDRGRLSEAETALRRAGASAHGEVNLRLAQVFRRRRQWDQALGELAKLNNAPQQTSEYFQKLLADAACERGIVLTEKGDRAAARAAFQSALELNPEHAEARRRLGGEPATPARPQRVP